MLFNKKTNILLSTNLIFSYFLVGMNTAHAAVIDNSIGKLDKLGKITGLGRTEAGDVGLYDKIAAFINIALGFVGVIAVIYIIYAGFKWITAQGNEQTVTESRSIIKSAVIGLIIVFVSFVIVNFVVDRVLGILGAE